MPALRVARTAAGSAALRAAGEVVWRLSGGPPRHPDGVRAARDGATVSACPWCHAAALNRVLHGTASEQSFENRESYAIPAEIVERDGQVWMRKTCAVHGTIEELLSSDAAFTARMESLYRPQDPDRAPPEGPRRQAAGLMLVVDLTNRCNMKCSPCFMDANQHSYVHEASLDDVRRILERATGGTEPPAAQRREIEVLFSGGEPTISPIFLDCVRLAKSLGINRVHVASNGIRFAQEAGFASAAKTAGLHGVFLQFDGLSESAHRGRGVGNLLEVKQAAIDRIHDAGLNIVLQVTVTNGVNNAEVGSIVEFAIRRIDRVNAVLFQPLVFTGRDELPTDEDRHRRRYTLAQLAHDLRAQSKFDWQPLRDWFPVSASGTFGNLLDALDMNAPRLSPAHDLHPTHAQFSHLMVDTVTGEAKPVAAFFAMDRFLTDAVAIAGVKNRLRARALLVGSILRNLCWDRVPEQFGLATVRRLFADVAGKLRGPVRAPSASATSPSRWRFLAVNAVWFEDAFNVDFNAVCRSCAPVTTQEGEFSFCAYNSMGWRQIIENRQRTADLASWHREHGRHPIYTHGATVPLEAIAAAGDKTGARAPVAAEESQP